VKEEGDKPIDFQRKEVQEVPEALGNQERFQGDKGWETTNDGVILASKRSRHEKHKKVRNKGGVPRRAKEKGGHPLADKVILGIEMETRKREDNGFSEEEDSAILTLHRKGNWLEERYKGRTKNPSPEAEKESVPSKPKLKGGQRPNFGRDTAQQMGDNTPRTATVGEILPGTDWKCREARGGERIGLK